jgi:FkbM family methyltransferase
MQLPPHVERETTVGPLLMPRDDTVFTPWFDQHRTWEPEESAALAALVRPGSSVVEIGAHVGYLTALMAQAAGPGGRVLAIEAHPGNYALLVENMRRLGLTQVRTEHAAAWRSSGEIELALSPDSSGDHRAYPHAGSTESVVVPAVTVDDLVDDAQPVHVVKIDAQGVDHIALKGMARTLARWRPVILAEFWPLGIRELFEEPAAVVRGYREMGYDVSVLERPGLGPNAVDTDIIAAAESQPGGFCSLLLHPAAPAAVGAKSSRAAAARGVLERGPVAPPDRSPRTPRGLARRALLRALRPYTAYERQIDEHLAAGIADLETRVAALDRPATSNGTTAAPAGHSLTLDYPPSALDHARWGWGRPTHAQLSALLRNQHGAFTAAIGTIAGYLDDLRRVPVESSDPAEPTWLNPSLPGLDGAAIYAFLRDRQPRRYFEVGSGNSTKFAARAKRDGALATELISVDPHPWTEIDSLCDTVVRTPFESVDRSLLDQLAPGDVVFFDGSHRAFMNSDAVTFFVDIVPSLPAGVLVAVHDVFLPDDYPDHWAERYYSEQYLLACWLLAAGERLAPVLAAWYVSNHTELDKPLEPLWTSPGFDRVFRHGGAFWFETRG